MHNSVIMELMHERYSIDSGFYLDSHVSDTGRAYPGDLFRFSQG